MPIAAIVLIVLGFVWWWPLGLVILALLLFGSRRMACWNYHGAVGWPHPVGPWASEMGQTHWQAKMERLQAKMDRVRGKMENLGRNDWCGRSRSSGNRAFDDYRQETLRRLEDEQREFKEFLERLRFAKDRQEFDQFMAERRDRPNDTGQGPQAPV